MRGETKADLMQEIKRLQRRIAKLEAKGGAPGGGEQMVGEGQYRAIIQTSLDGFWINDREGRFLDVNDAYCRMTGYGREELLRMRISDVEAQEKAEETVRRIWKVQERGYDRFETRHRRKDGTVIDIEASASYSDAGGGQFWVFLRDVTERKRAEKEIPSLSGFPEENPNPVLRVARDGTLLYINHAGMNLPPEWHLQLGEAVPRMLREAAVQAVAIGTTQRLDLEHGERVYWFSVAPVVAAGYANLYGRDVTEGKKAEEKLHAANQQLAASNQQLRATEQQLLSRSVNNLIISPNPDMLGSSRAGEVARDCRSAKSSCGSG